MRKTTMLASLIPAMLLAAPAHAGVGIGVAVGEPTGVSAQFEAPDGESALNVAAGRDFSDHLSVNADYVWIPDEWAINHDAWLPFYIGVGGFVKDHPADMGPHGGARMPLGVELEMRKVPIQVFTELAPEVVLVDTDPSMPHRGLTLTGALGVRATF